MSPFRNLKRSRRANSSLGRAVRLEGSRLGRSALRSGPSFWQAIWGAVKTAERASLMARSSALGILVWPIIQTAS